MMTLMQWFSTQHVRTAARRESICPNRDPGGQSLRTGEGVRGDLLAAVQTCLYIVCAACPKGHFAGEQSSSSCLVWSSRQKAHKVGLGAVLFFKMFLLALQREEGRGKEKH